MPKVSILMPVYNAEKTLQNSIDSILGQTFMDFEFIIYNDGSVDSSAQIIKSNKDSRIKFIDNKNNKGVSYSRAYLLKQVVGQYITWIDADDTCDLNRLEKQVAFLDNNAEYVFVGTGYALVSNGKIINRYLFKNDKCIRFYPAFCCASVMFRKGAMDGVNMNSVDGGGEDYAFLLQLINKGKVHNLTNVKYYYNQNNPNSVSKHKQGIENILNAFVIYRMGDTINPVEALRQLPLKKGICIAVWYVMVRGFKGLPLKYIVPTVLFGIWWKIMHKVSK